MTAVPEVFAFPCPLAADNPSSDVVRSWTWTDTAVYRLAMDPNRRQLDEILATIDDPEPIAASSWHGTLSKGVLPHWLRWVSRYRLGMYRQMMTKLLVGLSCRLPGSPCTDASPAPVSAS